MIAALTWSGFQDGLACRTSAATPAPCGDAIEVPDSVVPLAPLPTSVDTIDTPGPVTSGFMALSPLRGPPELNVAAALKPGLLRVPPGCSVTALPSAAMRAALAPRLVPIIGMSKISGL